MKLLKIDTDSECAGNAWEDKKYWDMCANWS